MVIRILVHAKLRVFAIELTQILKTYRVGEDGGNEKKWLNVNIQYWLVIHVYTVRAFHRF